MDLATLVSICVAGKQTRQRETLEKNVFVKTKTFRNKMDSSMVVAEMRKHYGLIPRVVEARSYRKIAEIHRRIRDNHEREWFTLRHQYEGRRAIGQGYKVSLDEMSHDFKVDNQSDQQRVYTFEAYVGTLHCYIENIEVQQHLLEKMDVMDSKRKSASVDYYSAIASQMKAESAELLEIAKKKDALDAEARTIVDITQTDSDNDNDNDNDNDGALFLRYFPTALSSTWTNDDRSSASNN